MQKRNLKNILNTSYKIESGDNRATEKKRKEYKQGNCKMERVKQLNNNNNASYKISQCSKIVEELKTNNHATQEILKLSNTKNNLSTTKITGR